MTDGTPGFGTREVVGVFHSTEDLEAAIDVLGSSNFDRSEFSLLAGEQAVREKLGHGYRKVAELEDELAAPRVAYIARESYGSAEGGLVGGLLYVGALSAAGAIVATGGTIAAAVIAAALAGGSGAAIGAILAKWLDEHRARRLSEQLDKGGLLLWVHVRDDEHERRAIEILRAHGADDVHAHDLHAARSDETVRDAEARMADAVTEADGESFPASDPPAFTGTTAGSPRKA